MIGLGDRSHRRRKHKRMPIVVLCEISAPETGNILGKGCVLDFSRGGMSVVTPAKLAWDASVNLTVDNLDQQGFIAAKVVNFRQVMDSLYSYGLEFEGLNSLQRIRIERAFKNLFRKLLHQPPR
jgi:c-di-GMP-binding flagellar brake protein YcgR